ncbi:MAG: MFS transporter [Nitrososphaerota archaeon]|nr:MFS transporter [Aigarchaeota archaeon]MDW8076413.1 MFS transporter [Nitrososphaerota archaeon]
MDFRSLSKELLTVFILLSLVSLFADMTYEGARSVLGSYAGALGATALSASLAGIGEFLGYVARLFTGLLAGYWRSSRMYWSLLFLGYVLNLVVCPLLALSGYWQVAILLIFLERVGKGLRTPVRDVILAEVAEKVGKGKAFGLHEALDQAGAVLGPSMVSITLYLTGNSYPVAFSLLAIPAAASIVFLFNAYTRYPNVRSAEDVTPVLKSGSTLSRIFWLYVISMSIMAIGFIHWVNISYYLRAEGVPDYLIAAMYLVAMLVDGLFALPMGLIYDKVGLTSLVLAPIFSASAVLTLLTGDLTSAVISSVFWGAAMGTYEGVARAAIADIVPLSGRAYGYGIFGTLFGVAWMAGSMVYGHLYQHGLNNFMRIFAVITEFAALVMLLICVRLWRKSRLWVKGDSFG